ncbi:MAG: glycosyl hydrolase 2 galactose-binding domain-containing protein [Acholeplasmataceae bacterium]
MHTKINGQWMLFIPHLKRTIEGRIPGSVYADLLSAGLIPDPFDQDNEYRVREWMRYDYVYHRTFDFAKADGQRHYLRFRSIDTVAAITLNDTVILETRNMHIRYTVDVTDAIRKGENRIAIRLESPIRAIEDEKKRHDLQLFEINDAMTGYSYLRKAHCMFGWDWGPQLPDAGIYGDVEIISSSVGLIDDPIIGQEHRNDTVRVVVRIPIRDRKDGTLSVTLKDPTGKTLVQSDESEFSITIDDPKLWWPRGYGEQPLYGITVTLSCDRVVQDEKEVSFGLRTNRIKRMKDAHGESFVYVHNGIDIFMKGSNYIIEDNLVSRMTESRTKKLFQDVLFANHNTIRIWGGGIYPPDWFYRIADENGILIWQDFMFSCSVYNADDEPFVDSLELEVKDVINRIGSHPCLALLCGNNEVETGISNWSVPHPTLSKKLSLKLFERLIPKWLEEASCDLPYWPSSPSSSGGFDRPNSHDRGDMHDWSVWHGKRPIEDYRRHIPRFMSEFGLQSFPELDTIRAFARPKDFDIQSRVMKSHQKNGTGNKKILYYIKKMFRAPLHFEGILYLSQLVQAEGIRYGVEHHRRHLGITMGSLYWQLNDCWPVASWSSIDYFGRYKALHYHSRKFYSDLLVSIRENRNSMDASIVVTNDRTTPFKGLVTCRLQTTDGRVIEKTKKPVEIPAQRAMTVMNRSDRDYRHIRNTLFLDVTIADNEGIVQSTNMATYVYDKHLELRNKPIRTSIGKQGTTIEVTLSSDVLHRFVWLKHEDDRFSDNFFHLLPNEPRTISFESERSLRSIKDRLTIRSLIDFYS